MNVSLIMDDALRYECALSSEADCTVTRNTQDFAGADVFRNMPIELIFFVSKEVTQGAWRIVIRTSYLSKGKSRKESVEVTSDMVTVSTG